MCFFFFCSKKMVFVISVLVSRAKGIIKFRDYIFNFHASIKCEEEKCKLQKSIDRVDNILQSDASENTKKQKFVLICVENSPTFNFFFKLYSKNVVVEVISKKHEGYEKKVKNLKAERKIVIENWCQYHSGRS